jgi:hypothetical protein
VVAGVVDTKCETSMSVMLGFNMTSVVKFFVLMFLLTSVFPA